MKLKKDRESTMHLRDIRKNYDENYAKMIRVINLMGGDDKISLHRQNKTKLYRQLRKLQREEEYLNSLEIKMMARFLN